MIRMLKAIVSLVLATLTMSAVAAEGAGAAEFTSASGTYPVTVKGSSTADVYDFFGSSINTGITFNGLLTAKGTSLTLTTAYGAGKAFGSFPLTGTCNSCGLNFTANGTVHFEGSITFDVYENSTKHTEGKPMCQVHIPSQTPVGTVTYTNNADGTITITGSISGITATQTRFSIFCPSGTHTSTANYTIQSGGIKISGTTSGLANAIHVK